MQGLIGFFVINEKKLSSHIYHISKNVKYSTQKINSYDQMIKIVLNLGIKKDDKNNYSYTKLTHI